MGGEDQKAEKYKSWKCIFAFCQQLFRSQLPTSNNYISQVSYSNWVKQMSIESLESKISDG